MYILELNGRRLFFSPNINLVNNYNQLHCNNTATVTFLGNTLAPIPNGPDGLSPETAGDNAYQIKMSHPSSPDGLYWIKNDNINGGTPFQIYADMTTNGGGWTLILSNSLNGTGWTFVNSILKNENDPPVNGQGINVQYSIISYANYLKKGAGWQYMIEAYQRGMYGGIWQPNQDYSFVEQWTGSPPFGDSLKNTNGWRKNLTEITKFPGNEESWDYGNNSIEFRMPWYVNHDPGEAFITTDGKNGGWWGTLVSDTSNWNPAPWIGGTTHGTSPGTIWYWVR